METIIAAVVLLGGLIFIHELGHFLVAKKSGVGVEKFSLGFGKKLFGTTVGETEYLISAIPFGGFVKLAGEEPGEETADPEKSFSNKSVAIRLAVVSAGPIFNLILAVIIFSLVYMVGIEVPSNDAWVGKTMEGYPAVEAGIIKGDRIVEIEGKSIDSWQDMAAIIHKSPGKRIEMTIQRENRTFSLAITPQTRESMGIGLIGIEPMRVTEKFGPVRAMTAGVIKTWEITYLTFVMIKKMFSGQVSAKNLGGPILIAQIAGKVANDGFLAFITYAAIISINLGVLNLLPIPILDGGHILFFLIEAVTRKPVSLNLKEKAQQVGLFLLVTLMVFALYNDVMRFFE